MPDSLAAIRKSLDTLVKLVGAGFALVVVSAAALWFVVWYGNHQYQQAACKRGNLVRETLLKQSAVILANADTSIAQINEILNDPQLRPRDCQ